MLNIKVILHKQNPVTTHSSAKQNSSIRMQVRFQCKHLNLLPEMHRMALGSLSTKRAQPATAQQPRAPADTGGSPTPSQHPGAHLPRGARAGEPWVHRGCCRAARGQDKPGVSGQAGLCSCLSAAARSWARSCPTQPPVLARLRSSRLLEGCTEPLPVQPPSKEPSSPDKTT